VRAADKLETIDSPPPVSGRRWLLAFGVAGSAAGWAGQLVFSGWAFLAAVVLWEAVWGVRRLRFESRHCQKLGTGRGDLLYLFPLTILISAIVALALFQTGLAAWYLVEIALGGVAGAAAKSLLGGAFGLAIGAAVWFLLWRTRLPEMPQHEITLDEEVEILRKYNLQVIRRCTFFVLAAAGMTVGWVSLLSRTGVRDESLYPPAEQSPYMLPFPAGTTYVVCQGNRGVVSHRDWEEFAYDFAMPVGSEVCAARGGIVTRVIDKNDGHGRHALNNEIAIDHGDGTVGRYLHIRKGGSHVHLGERVVRGQRIAESGHVGLSMLPHLHFVLDDWQGNSLPITFADVNSDSGIPRMFKRYTSQNVAP
jgi:hypothetical protein